MSIANPLNSRRLIHTPSQLARTSLFYLQEIGVLSCEADFCSKRDALDSFLFLFVPRGHGTLSYMGNTYNLKPGCIAWINCNHGYSYKSSSESPLELIWIHCCSHSMKELCAF